MRALIDKIRYGYDKLESFFIVGFTMLIGLVTIYSIIIRFLGLQGFAWTDELGRIMLILTTLVGSSMAVNTNSHMAVDTLFAFVSQRVGCLIRAFTCLISGLLYTYLTYYTWTITVAQHSIGRTMESTKLPISWVWLIIAIALGTMALRYYIQIGVNIKHFVKHDLDESESAISKINHGGEET